MQRNNTDFDNAIHVMIDDLKANGGLDDQFLRRHQVIVKHLITTLKTSRGQLALHGLGSGKSILAASIANWFKVNEPERRVVIIMAKSLESNMKKGMTEYIRGMQKKATEDNKKKDLKFAPEDISPDEDPALAAQTYDFVSMNASNTFIQILRAAKSAEEVSLEKRMGKILEVENAFENTLYIVDEAQKFFTAISNGSDNAVKFYDGVMNAKNIKLLFLSGTPMTKSPLELIPCMNMLAGYEYSSNGSKYSLFPEDPDIFEHHFIEEVPEEEPEAPEVEHAEVAGGAAKKLVKTKAKTVPEAAAEVAKTRKIPKAPKIVPVKKVAAPVKKVAAPVKKVARHSEVKQYKIINEAKFGNRTKGLVSYFNSLYHDGGIQPGFPEAYPTQVIKVPMSIKQHKSYSAARIKERQEGLSETGERIKSKKFAGRGFSKNSSASSTYRTESRMDSFYAFPEHALGPAVGKKMRPRYVDKLTKADFGEDAPMITTLLANITKHGTSPGTIGNPYVGAGLAVVAKALECLRGYKPYRDMDSSGKFSNIEENITDEIEFSDDRNASTTLLTDNGKVVNPLPEPNVKRNSKGIIISAPLPGKNLRYAILSGTVSTDDRRRIVEVFSSPENVNGALIHLLLISRGGAEGIDCKYGRHQHNLPGFDKASELQFFGRLVRWNSHADLPPAQRNVTSYMYLADIPIGAKPSEPETTHVWMYNRGNAKYDLIMQFTRVLMKYSIDCYLHKELLPEGIECATCEPTDMPLFDASLEKDMTMPDPCSGKAVIAKRKSANHTELNEIKGTDGIMYGYDTSGVVYSYRPEIVTWREIDGTHPEFDYLLNQVNKKGSKAWEKILGF